jgi:hypothetical protein
MFDVIEEPCGDVLVRLLRAVGRHAAAVLLVVRDDLGLTDAGGAVITRLRNHLVSEKRSASWPGTSLQKDQAAVLEFSVNAMVLEELISASYGLYGWQQPSLPEDLALLRENGTVLLGSICHERDAYLSLTDEEYRSIAAAIPEIDGIVRPRAKDSE